MPELPEVETTRRGISPHLIGKKIHKVDVFNKHLRWEIDNSFQQNVAGSSIKKIERRAKYLLFENQKGYFLMHLGMSGSLRITHAKEGMLKHDHIVFSLPENKHMRFNDPRRFGCALWLGDKPYEHKLLNKLGFEPLKKEADPEILFKKSRKRTCSIKNFIMDNHIIVGVGNIYANESLFLSGIRPTRQAGKVTRKEFKELLNNIQKVLEHSIELGGSTLNDFVNADGKPGYFQQTLRVYGRKNEPCFVCDTAIKTIVIGQRASYYCPSCQQ